MRPLLAYLLTRDASGSPRFFPAAISSFPVHFSHKPYSLEWSTSLRLHSHPWNFKLPPLVCNSFLNDFSASTPVTLKTTDCSREIWYSLHQVLTARWIAEGRFTSYIRLYLSARHTQLNLMFLPWFRGTIRSGFFSLSTCPWRFGQSFLSPDRADGITGSGLLCLLFLLSGEQ